MAVQKPEIRIARHVYMTKIDNGNFSTATSKFSRSGNSGELFSILCNARKYWKFGMEAKNLKYL